jgi:hypothetical protein
MRRTTDCSGLGISHHAVCRYAERVLGHPEGEYVPFPLRVKAVGRLAHSLRYAREFGRMTHGGYEQEAWRLGDCVVLAKQGTVTTVLTMDMVAGKGHS